uniref:Regulator of ribonuclease-like protein 2 n=1 Tax=Aegilops tauschii TaxID=37682 RepID=N1QUS3_AEGTA
MAALPLATAEACDANSHMITSGELRALQPVFRVYGGRRLFAGPVVTVKVFEDNVLVRGILEEKGQGRVLIDGCDIGVRAPGSHPVKSDKRGMGEKHVPVTVAGARICDGEWLYADADGILVSRTELSV